ncbi:hypothetical protein ASG39_10780 [Rhizobium sp. Leaf371]|uniref:sulfatase-like hydrolase/transferase n=1 Tax=Rhizobium sp. Leaf371 TaxID=1736355 RepID=UPI000712D53D|nr:sulfatase-like hydrolase/transferase [Rhizobium sp. Leaf371]KQS64442.1 hypothetical protein ASG39_10780 [Rhizobium sp. Leaf371]
MIAYAAGGNPPLGMASSRRATIRLIGALVVVPNILFLLAMPFYVAVRTISPLFYLLAAAAAYFLPAWAAYPVFLLAALLDGALVAMLAFNLPVGDAIDTLAFLATIDVAASSVYVAFILAMIATALTAAWLFNRFRPDAPRASPTAVAFAALAVIALDTGVNRPFSGAAPAFDSAIVQNDLTADRIAVSGRNMLFVMVEGLGAFADPQERSLLADILQDVTRGGRYWLTSGTSRYSGSTTGAAARELCGRWGSWVDFMGDRTFDCLPRRLSEAGMSTLSFHGYSRDMFFRHHWYPQIGFERSTFLEDLAAEVPTPTPARCGNVFKGLCDTEIVNVADAALKADPDRRKFVYVLTLNTHIPYEPSAIDRLDCGSAAPAIDNRTVCDLTNLWSDLFRSVAAIAQDPDLPPTDILIVGDHQTPLWERAARRHFKPGLVDWYRLESLRSAPAGAKARLASGAGAR